MTKQHEPEDFGRIHNALAVWWQSQGIEAEDAAYVLAAMGGGGSCGWYTTDEKHMNEALVNLLQEMRYARQSAWNVLEFCPPALTPANSCERLAKGECRVRQPLSIRNVSGSAPWTCGPARTGS
jgi:hypothetical protein